MNYVLSGERCPNCQIPDDRDSSSEECLAYRQGEMNFYIKEGHRYPEVRQAWLSNVNSVRRGEPVPCADFQDKSF